jgi:formate dehydrogenase (coenzyme F420) beta subunit
MQELVNVSKELFKSKKVSFIIGYTDDKKRIKPFIARDEKDAEKLTFNHYSLNNLSVYLTRVDKSKEGMIGIIAKGCDLRAIIALIQENQIKREDVFIIGVNCNGVVSNYDREWKKEDVAVKCVDCSVRSPKIYDVLIGKSDEFEKPNDENLELIKKLEALTPNERWNFWEKEFEKCIKCYACRQACPLCYCEKCIVDKTTPRWIESSATTRGNFSWNIIRAFHLAGRCIGCNECERACPMEIQLSLMNRKMGMIATTEFNYRHGTDINEPTLVGDYRISDKEDFIK